MKFDVKCKSCGTLFTAPTSLAGQIIRCPKCAATLMLPHNTSTATSRPDPNPTPGHEELEDPVDIDFESLAASTFPEASTRNDQPQSRRTQQHHQKIHASESQEEFQGRMQRLYGLYTNRGLAIHRRGKFTLGLGISLAVVLLAGVIGFFLLKTRSKSGPMITQTNKEFINAVDTRSPRTEVHTAKAAKQVQVTDDGVLWSSPTPDNHSEIRLRQFTIDLEWEDLGRLHQFMVTFKLESTKDAGLMRQAQVILYRAETETGPFRQVDKSSINVGATDEPRIQLMDATFPKTEKDRVYYRLRAIDGLGKLLFDTSAVTHPVLAHPTVTNRRLQWHGTESPTSVDCLVYLNLPGWTDVLIERIIADGTNQINVPLPQAPTDLPLRIMASARLPHRYQSDRRNGGHWKIGPVKRVVVTHESHLSTPPSGVIPVWKDGSISYRVIGPATAFEDVVQQDDVLTFQLADEAGMHWIDLPQPPRPRAMIVTPYDHETRLSWNNQSLVANQDQYHGKVAITIYRTMLDGPTQSIGSVPITVHGFIDAEPPQDIPLRYHIAVTCAAAPGIKPLLRADAFLTGTGRFPVLLRCDPRTDAKSITTNPALKHLNIAIGKDELVYPETDRTAIQLQQRILRSLLDNPHVRIFDRHMQTSNLSAVPTQIVLRLVDRLTPNGTQLDLWATDLVSGQTTRLTDTPKAEDDKDAILALQNYLNPRLRDQPPQIIGDDSVVPVETLTFDPLIPALQARRFYDNDRLIDQLTNILRHKFPEVKIISSPPTGGESTLRIRGRSWAELNGQVGLSLRATNSGSGQVIGIWSTTAANSQSLASCATWIGTLTVSPPLLNNNRSELVGAERSIKPIHPVWRSFAANGTSLPPTTPTPTIRWADVFAFGATLPTQLRIGEMAARHSNTEPIATIRPYTAPSWPPMFEQWIDNYARYLQEDFAAFQDGITQWNLAFQGNQKNVVPHIIVRGKHKKIGGLMLSQIGRIDGRSELALNTRTFLPVGEAKQPLIDYHHDLSRFFRDNPWTAYLAWKMVPSNLSEPFLKVELLGIKSDGGFNKIHTPIQPPPPHQYVAAKILADAGNPLAINYQKQTLALAARDFNSLIQNKGRRQQQRTYSLYILLIENDPGTVEKLSAPSFRDQYLTATDKTITDLMRLLLDRVGPGAWGWKHSENSVQWDRFRFRSLEEVHMVYRQFANMLSPPLRQQLRSFLEDDPPPTIFQSEHNGLP